MKRDCKKRKFFYSPLGFAGKNVQNEHAFNSLILGFMRLYLCSQGFARPSCPRRKFCKYAACRRTAVQS